MNMNANMQGTQPLTAKELEYIADSLSNEDMMIKLCATAAATSQNQQLQQMASHFENVHSQHYQTLLQTLQHHQPIAPTQIQ